SSAPCFSGDGRYLLFVSNRDFNPAFSRTEYSPAYLDVQRVYLVTLAKDTPSPFKPKSDEVNGAEPPAPPAADKPAPLRVDLDGLAVRVVGLPVPPATYRNLRSAGGAVYYIRSSSREPAPALELYDLAAQKETNLGGGVNGF